MKTDNTIFLKPCPWCGNSGYLRVEGLGYSHGRGYPGCHSYQVICSNISCNAKAPNGRHDDIYEEPDIAQQKAIDAWNLRYVP